MFLSRVSRLVLLLALASMVSCSGGDGTTSSPPPAPAGSAAVSFSLTDTPPMGVTVLSFEVNITGATLQPGNVSLISTPKEIEIKKLEVEAAFLSTVNVPAGTYTSLNLTLGNSELTILNESGSTISFVGVNCATGQVCEFQNIPGGSVTVNFSPSLTVVANTPAGLLVDVNLNNIIQTPLGVSFGGANALTVTQLQIQQGTGELDEIEDLNGIVKNKGTDTFDLQTTTQTFTGIKVDGTTEFEDFDSDANCTANNFTCVMNDQAVEVDLRLMPGGMFLAKKIEFEDDQVDDELEGVITSVNSLTQFQIVVVEELRDIAGIDVGNAVTVNLATSCATGGCFRVDDDGLKSVSNFPNTQATLFESATDTAQLLPGQVVQVRRTGSPSAMTIDTDRVRLRMARFTAMVASLAPPNFNVGGLSSLFTSTGTNQIQVQTSSETDFDNVSGVGGLTVGDTVSLRGLLFKNTPSDPILTAKKVRKR